MTSKTFKNVTNSGTEVYVGEGIDADSVQLIIRNVGSGIGKAGIYLNTSDIPALMLALGEHLPPIPEIVRDGSYEAYMSVVMTCLGQAVPALEAEAAEAKERAELEALALTLSNEYVTQLGFDSVESWDDSGERRKTAWVAVARIAREFGAEK